MLQDHDFKHLFDVSIGELALVDLCSNVCIEDMNTFVWPLVHFQEELRFEVPEMVF